MFFRTLREIAQIKRIAQQMFPGQVKSFMDAYNNAISRKLEDPNTKAVIPGSLLIASHPVHTNERFRLFSNWTLGLSDTSAPGVIVYDI